MNSRTIKFPADAYCGELYWGKPQNLDEVPETVEARGDVLVPTGERIELWVHNEMALSSLPLLASLPADSFDCISLACTNATDANLQYLTHFTRLRGLAIWETHIGDEGLRLLKNFPVLEWLDLGDTKITDSGLQHLQSLPALRELCLPNTVVGNSGMKSLAALKNLKKLFLSNTNVDDNGVIYLGQLNQLEYLSIYETKITEAGYLELKQNLTTCKIVPNDLAPNAEA